MNIFCYTMYFKYTKMDQAEGDYMRKIAKVGFQNPLADVSYNVSVFLQSLLRNKR